MKNGNDDSNLWLFLFSKRYFVHFMDPWNFDTVSKIIIQLKLVIDKWLRLVLRHRFYQETVGFQAKPISLDDWFISAQMHEQQLSTSEQWSFNNL